MLQLSKNVYRLAILITRSNGIATSGLGMCESGSGRVPEQLTAVSVVFMSLQAPQVIQLWEHKCQAMVTRPILSGTHQL